MDSHQAIPLQAQPAITPVVVVGQKSVIVAVLLAFFFGPLGMLYATPVGALVMFGINLVVGIFTLGIGLAITWPACAIWAGIAADKHNKILAAAGAANARVMTI